MRAAIWRREPARRRDYLTEVSEPRPSLTQVALHELADDIALRTRL